MSIQGGAIAASDLMSIGEVARMAGVYREAVDKAMKHGLLRYTRHDGRRMASREDAEAWSRAIRFVPARWQYRGAAHAE